MILHKHHLHSGIRERMNFMHREYWFVSKMERICLVQNFQKNREKRLIIRWCFRENLYFNFRGKSTIARHWIPNYIQQMEMDIYFGMCQIVMSDCLWWIWIGVILSRCWWDGRYRWDRYFDKSIGWTETWEIVGNCRLFFCGDVLTCHFLDCMTRIQLQQLLKCWWRCRAVMS